MELYKILAKDGQSVHGGNLKWSLPTKKGSKWTPGDWHTVKPPIKVCSTGLHLVSEGGLIKWYKPNTVIYLAEGAGLKSTDTEKTAFEKARLLRPVKPKYPAYFKRAIGFIEQEIPDVPWFKPDGKPDLAWKLFEAPTLLAARDAARDAAMDAAEAAARDAARAAAWDAAWAAARAAAWDAAEAAAGDAAEAAAWAAARDAQLFTLTQHICGDLKIPQTHRDHAIARWLVWQKGYALLCDVNGVLYVYAVKKC